MPLELLVAAMEKSQQKRIEGAIELQQQWLGVVLRSFLKFEERLHDAIYPR